MNSRASFLSSSTFVLPPSRLLPCYACVEGARKAGAAKPEDDGNWTHRLGNAPHFFAAINITHPPPPHLLCHAPIHTTRMSRIQTTTRACGKQYDYPQPQDEGDGRKVYVCTRARVCGLSKPNQTKACIWFRCLQEKFKKAKKFTKI